MSAETPIIRAILDGLHKLGIESWRCQSGKVKVRGGWMELAPTGTPDLIGYYPRFTTVVREGARRLVSPGTMFGVEVKVPLGRHKHSEAQLAWGLRLEQAGGVYILARGLDEALQGLGLIPAALP